MIDLEAFKDTPEYLACLPFFEAGARMFGSDVRNQYENVFSTRSITHFLIRDGKNTMWRSTTYGTREAATKLVALATRMGYVAAAEQVYGQADNDWAMVITGLQTPPTT